MRGMLQAGAEQRILRLSIGVTVIVSLFGVVFGLLSGSLSIVFDGVFAAIDAAMSGLALFVSRLVSRESDNRRFQFGYWHIEPMVLAFNGGTLMLLCFYAFLNAVDSLLAGGRQLDFDWAIAYAVTVCVACWHVLLRTSGQRQDRLGLRAPRRAELADVGGDHLGAAARLRHRLVAERHALWRPHALRRSSRAGP